MKKSRILIYIVFLTLLFVTFGFLCSANTLQSKEKNKLEIVYPQKDSTINASSTFFVGNTNPKAILRINNQKVFIYPNGGFVHVVKLKPGVNSFTIQSTFETDKKEVIYTFNAPEPESTIAQLPLIIDTNSISPKESVIYRSEDLLQVSFKGSTGNKAYFSIGKQRLNIPMTEDPPKKVTQSQMSGSPYSTIQGIYRGCYKFQNKDNFNGEPLVVTLASGKEYFTSQSVVKVSTIPLDPVFAEVIKDYATVRTAPEKERLTPLPLGTVLDLTGKIGKAFRFKYGETKNGWISEEEVRTMAKNIYFPTPTMTSVITDSDENNIYVKISLSQKIPFIIEHLKENSMSINLYGVKVNPGVLSLNCPDKFIQEINSVQASPDSLKINIKVSTSNFWGYKYYYEGENLIVELRKPPKINSKKPLENIKICIDPGHGGTENGSIGPTGVPEKEINLNIALKLKFLLEEKGAVVTMTRGSDEDVDLYERTRLARENGSVILLSIHNNALPDGRNPYDEHGSSTYYYHLQSLPLAKILQQSMLDDLGFKDYGIYNSSFVMTRPSESLSLLIESGFMINPDEYNQLITPEFQDKIATSILRGLEYFFFTEISKN